MPRYIDNSQPDTTIFSPPLYVDTISPYTATGVTLTGTTVATLSNALTAGTGLTSGGTYNGGAARTFASTVIVPRPEKIWLLHRKK